MVNRSKSTKTTESTRVIDVVPEIIQAPKPLLKVKKGFLIGLTPDAITRRFERIREKADTKCRFHDLRHYHASYMLAANIPDKYSMNHIGRATNNMLHTVYQHLRSNAQKEFADILNASISAVLKVRGIEPLSEVYFCLSFNGSWGNGVHVGVHTT